MLSVRGGQGRRVRDVVDAYQILHWTWLLALNALAWIALGAWVLG